MKKLFLLLFSFLILVACEGPMGPQGPQGPQGVGTGWHIQYITVKPTQWTRNVDPAYPSEVYYTYAFVPEVYQEATLDDREFYFYDGAMFAYELSSDGVQKPLYNGFFRQERNGYIFYESLSYDFTIDDVVLYLYVNDSENEPNGDLTFKLVNIW